MKLSKEEVEFLKLVIKYPGAKLSSGEATHWVDDGSEHGKSIALWEKPEKLGLIECVGSYKWIPTDRLGLCITVDGEAVLVD